MLYRLFPFRSNADPGDQGGPFHIPRALQVFGRHDNPASYGAMYASRDPRSVVAEFLRARGLRTVDESDLKTDAGHPYAIASLDDEATSLMLDLDDPQVLVDRSLRPSSVATRERKVTQRIARAVFGEGYDGFQWWSTIEASWLNITLFAERAVPKIRLVGPPEHLRLDHPAVIAAAEVVGVRLAS